MHRDVDAADRTLMRLSDLLRLTLERLGEQEVTLNAELDFLRKYLEIEGTRFADRLVVRYDVQPETLDALVPTLLLQPLVENAIKHGVAQQVRRRATSTSPRGATTTCSGSKCATTASGCRKTRSRRCRKASASRPPARGCSTSSAPTTVSSSIG